MLSEHLPALAQGSGYMHLHEPPAQLHHGPWMQTQMSPNGNLVTVEIQRGVPSCGSWEGFLEEGMQELKKGGRTQAPQGGGGPGEGVLGCHG